MNKAITIIIIVLLAIGVGYWLFSISPKQQQVASSGYNSFLATTAGKTLASPPAFDPNTDHYEGSASSTNVFVEYGDLQCPACAAYNDMLKTVPTTFSNTVFVFRYFPLIQIHQNSVEAALADEAAGAQGKYWEMHDILFKNQPEWEELSDPLDQFSQYAQQVGINDINQFKSDITSKKYLSVIQNNFNQANALGLDSTPTFFINGHKLTNDTVDNMFKQAQSQKWLVE